MADVITDFGRAQLAGLASNTVSPPATYYGNVGTGAGTAGITDTTLFTEVGSARIACTTTRVTTSVASDTAQYAFTYTATGSISVTNAGVTPVSSAGSFEQKSDHATIPLVSGDSIAYTFKKRIA